MAVTQSQITIILHLSFTFYILKKCTLSNSIDYIAMVTGGAPPPGAPVVGTPLPNTYSYQQCNCILINK